MPEDRTPEPDPFALDAPEPSRLGSSRGRASRSLAAIPDIAPPVLLEPIPEPTITLDDAYQEVAEREPADLATAADPYAWASEAASSRERSGRTFDQPLPAPMPAKAGGTHHATGRTLGTAVWPEAPEDQPLPMKDTGAILPKRADTGRRKTHRYELPQAEPLRKVERRTEITDPDRGTDSGLDPVLSDSFARPAPAPIAVDDSAFKWALGTLAAVVSASVIGLVVYLLSAEPEAEPVLKPVVVDVDAARPGARVRRGFAVPPEQPVVPPGSTTGVSQTFAERQRAAVALRAEQPPANGVSALRITSDPEGATVRIDGRVSGSTPLTTELPPGTYTLELLRDGYGTVRDVVTLEKAQHVASFDLVPSAARGNVEIHALGWAGAALSIDGQPAGVVPTTAILTAGTHTFELTLGGNTRTVERKLLVAEGQSLRIELAD